MIDSNRSIHGMLKERELLNNMSDFEKAILDFPNQLTFNGLDIKNEDKLKSWNKPDGVIVCGMGGSGLPGTILENIAGNIGLKSPVLVWKSHGLPEHSFKNPLYIFVSFSGNTEEIIAGLEEGLGKEQNTVCVTTGGRLEELAKENDLPHIVFGKAGLTPRQASGRMFYAITKVLSLKFPLKIQEYFGILDSKAFQKQGEALAKNLKDKIILIYTYPEYAHLSYFWKIGLNETAKQPAFVGSFPEVNHNEVVGFTKFRYPFSVLFLKDKDSKFNWLNKKSETVKKFLNKFGISSQEVILEGDNKEEKTWQGVMLSYWTSFYLANISNVDPASTDIIDEIKKN